MSISPNNEPAGAGEPTNELAEMIIPAADGLVGRSFAGYQVLAILGEGPLGRSYIAEREGIQVRLKILHDEWGHDALYISRFLEAAKAAKGLRHQNLAALLEFGEETGRLYLVHELVAGCSLAELLSEQGSLSVAGAIALISGVTMGLAKMHSSGVVCAGLKPSDIILAQEGVARITDVGLAKPAPGDYARVGVQIALGTPIYQAPQVAGGEKFDVRADLFALGACLYHMLSGVAPFEVPVSGMDRRVYEECRPLGETAPQVPRRALALVDRLLAVDPAGRYADVMELLAELNQLRRALGMDTGSAASGKLPRQELHQPPPEPEKTAVADALTRENRRYRRVNLRLVGEVRRFTPGGAKSQETLAQIKNMSLAGVYLETNQLYPVDTLVEVALFAPSGGTVYVKGVVRWTSELEDLHGMGIEFVLDPHDPAQALLEQILPPAGREDTARPADLPPAR